MRQTFRTGDNGGERAERPARQSLRVSLLFVGGALDLPCYESAVVLPFFPEEKISEGSNYI